jgi:glycosyltransferase involved in cell wall biosynthesis
MTPFTQPDTHEHRPLVSVVVPTYNRAHLLRRAIKSVLAQTFSDFELIIVDDGSTDETNEAVEEFDDPRIRFIRQPVRGGANRARNRGIEASRGEWVAFLDSDDEWLPRRLEAQVKRLQQDDPMGATVGYCLIVKHNDLTQETRPSRKSVHEGDVFDDLLLDRMPKATSAYMVKRSALLEVDGFDETMPSRQDIDLWLRLAQAGNRFAAVSERLVVIHSNHGPRISRDSTAKLRGARLFNRKWDHVMRRRFDATTYWRRKLDRSRKMRRALRRSIREARDRGQRSQPLRYFLHMLSLLPEAITARVRLGIAELHERTKDRN